VLTGLVRGDEVVHHGEHYDVEARFLPAARRPEGMPVWLAARWPNRRPVDRALRYDGLVLIDTDDPASLGGIVERARALGRPFDVVVEHQDDHPAQADRWEAAGATWLLTSFDPFSATAAGVGRVADAGPAAG
jgi:hypothetical protein